MCVDEVDVAAICFPYHRCSFTMRITIFASLLSFSSLNHYFSSLSPISVIVRHKIKRPLLAHEEGGIESWKKVKRGREGREGGRK